MVVTEGSANRTKVGLKLVYDGQWCKLIARANRTKVGLKREREDQ